MFGLLPLRLHTSTLWKLMLQMQQHYLTCLTMTSPVKLTSRKGASKSSNLRNLIPLRDSGINRFMSVLSLDWTWLYQRTTCCEKWETVNHLLQLP